MNTKAALDRALPLFAQKADYDISILIAFFIAAGLSKTQATEVVEFAPLAFGRALMDGMGVVFDDEYIRLDDDGEERLRRKLADEPMFVAALAAAPEFMRNAGQDPFAAIAMRSAELQAVNEALNAGVSPDGLIASAPVMVWGEESPPAPVQAPAKPWWKIW
jgi:hypothetical protein